MNKNINLSFQGLRGLFAIGVLISHCFFMSDYASTGYIFDNFMCKFANANFFFVISGFLIYNSNKVSSFFEYIKKKLIKIYPLYFLILMALVALEILMGEFVFSGSYIIKLVLNIFLLQGWGGLSTVTAMYTVAWFLSSLLFCYIVGFFLIKLRNNNKKIADRLILTLAIVLLLYKVILAIIFPDGNTGYYFCYLIPLAGLADFLFGMLVANWVKKFKLSSSTILILQILSVIMVVVLFATKQYIPRNYCRAFVTLPINLLLVAVFNQETSFSRCVFGNKVAVFLGNISFEIYLLHTLIISFLTKLSFINNISATISPFVTLFILIAVTVVGSYIYTVVYKFCFKKFSKK